MLRACLILIATTLAMAHSATAGAWPRERGSGFASISQDIFRRGDGGLSTYTTLFAEYGVTEKLTFGLKAGMRGDRTYHEGLAFVRYPLTSVDATHKIALEFAVGVVADRSTTPQALLQPGIAWGRGFETGRGAGWIGLEASVALTAGDAGPWGKIDLTLGLSPNDRSHLILQVQTHHDRFGPSVRLVPSYVRRIGERLRVEVGLIQPLGGDLGTGLTAGTWFEW